MENDRKYQTQRMLLEAIEGNLNRLENGDLSLSELSNHLKLIQTLYERTVVLQYKAFEKYATENETASQERVPLINKETEVITTPTTETSHSTIFPTISFEFPHEEQVERTEESAPISPQETSEQEDTKTSLSEVFFTEQAVENEKNEHQHSPIYDRFSTILKNPTIQIGLSRPATLSDSFGLNERLLFVNELFGGSSDEFMRAIEFLETIPIASSTITFFEDLAKQYDWDLESQAVEDFMLKISRKYV